MSEGLDSLLWASAAMCTYVLVSLAVGDRFPFSRYSMYASLKGRVQGAVLYVEADGVAVDIARLWRFSGVDPTRIDPRGHPCSQEWAVYEVRRWVAEHLEAGLPLPEEAGRVPVEIGFRLVSVEGFKLHEDRVLLTRGSASWRPR